jgi:hypothetical protein
MIGDECRKSWLYFSHPPGRFDEHGKVNKIDEQKAVD